MKPSRHFSQILQWSVVAVVIAIVIVIGIMTNITLRSIEKNLPITLLTELEALDLLLEDLAEVDSAAEATRRVPNPENYIQLRLKAKIVFDGVVRLRETYVFDNLIQASAFHAVVAPAISDIQIWLLEGVSGYGPETTTALDIIISRITEAFSKARTLNRNSQKNAQKILNSQRIKLESFLFNVNLLFLLTLTITVIMIFLVAHRQVSLRRELEAQIELRLVEKTLQETEELYSKLISAIPDIVVRTDVNGQILFLNDLALQISGYQRAEVLGKNLLEFIAPEEHESAIKNRSLMFDRKLGPREYSLIMKDGGKIPFEVNSDVLRMNDGTPYGIVNICRNIIERKRAEEERRVLEDRLRHADKMESIGTLAGGIAHDFNNLLMGIQGYASLTLLDLDPSHPHYERIKRIEEQVQSGADLTKQLLGFARGGRYEVRPTDMNDILEKTSSMFGRTKKEISIHRKYGKDLRSVEVDQGQMEQAFMNLYVNAWQAMLGGGEIYLETENVILEDEQVFPYAVKQGKYVKITITDTGTGMDEKTRERIFDPFFTTKEMGRGTGLGLATVYGIIKGHKGIINVDSEPGHGTTFTIHLPASEKEVVQEKTVAGTITKGTETILLVDDEQMVLEVTRELLESIGYRVYAVGSGQEAIAVYLEKQKEIDLVILDMIMPGISGGETFDRLKEINPNIRVLLSSGYSIKGEAQTIMDRGCNGFLQKPFRLEKLSRKFREILD